MGDFGRCEGGGRRSAIRQTAPLVAVLSTLTRSHAAVVVDVSQTGVRVRGDDLPDDGEELNIGIEGVRTFGLVSWKHDGECGIAFDDHLSEPDVAILWRKAANSRGYSIEARAAFDDWNLGLAR